MIITEEQKEEYKNATICHICKKKLCDPAPCEYVLEIEKRMEAKAKRILEARNKLKAKTELEAKNKLEARKTLETQKKLEDTLYREVCDHDHLTGLNRGAAHSICNLNYKVPSFIPVFFHNFSGYNSRLLVREIDNDENSIKLIASNKENYILFSKMIKYTNNENIKKNIELRFLDSYRFQPSSLSELAKKKKDV